MYKTTLHPAQASTELSDLAFPGDRGQRERADIQVQYYFGGIFVTICESSIYLR